MDYSSFLPESNEKKKVPYDMEPISRYNPKRVEQKYKAQTSRWVAIVLTLIVVSNAVMGGLIAFLWRRDNVFTGSKSSLNGIYPGSNTSNTVSSDPIAEGAVSLAKRSAVSVRAWKSSTSYNIGSGVIIDNHDNYVTMVTNYHVVYLRSGNFNESTNAGDISSNIYIYLCDDLIRLDYDEDGSMAIKCEYVGGSYENDIAVIRFYIGNSTEEGIKNKDKYDDSNACACTIADSSKVRAGDTAFTVGDSQGYGVSVTTGVVSIECEMDAIVDVRDVGTTNSSLYQYMTLIRISVAINGGNSGGGLFNSNGELIGLVNSKYSQSNNGAILEGMALAIPSNLVAGVAYSINENFIAGTEGSGVCKYATSIVQNSGRNYFYDLGIRFDISTYTEAEMRTGDTEEYTIYANKYRFTIVGFSSGASSLSNVLGKLRVGDTMVSVTISKPNGEADTIAIDTPYSLKYALLWLSPDDILSVKFIRSGTTYDETVTINSVETVG